MGIEVQYLEKAELNQKSHLAISQKQEGIDCVYYRKKYCRALTQNRKICKSCPHYVPPKEEINIQKFFLKIIGMAMLFLKSFGISGTPAGHSGSSPKIR